MHIVQLTDRTMEAYMLFIGDGSESLTQAGIARLWSISSQGVSKHKKRLIKAGYITKAGTYYIRGDHYKFLEQSRIYKEFKQGFNATDSSTDRELCFGPGPKTEVVPFIRAHLNARLIYEVEKVGDMVDIKIDKKIQKVFESKPYNTRGSTKWKGKIKHPSGWSASLMLFDNGHNIKLHIWVKEQTITYHDLKRDPSLRNKKSLPFRIHGFQVLTLLERYGWWKFKKTPSGRHYGDLRGEVEYAAPNKALDEIAPDNFNGFKDKKLWRDRSKGYNEWESRDLELMEALTFAPEKFKELQEQNGKLKFEIERMRMENHKKELQLTKELGEVWEHLLNRERIRKAEREQQKTLKDGGMYQ